MTESSNDADLVASAQAGRREAFDTLVHRHYDTAFAVAYARLQAREAAEDVVQEAFLRAWLQLATLRDGKLFGPWVVRIVRNLSVNWQRPGSRAARLSRMLPLEDMESEPMADSKHPLEGLIDREQQQLLEKALAGLSPEEREIVLSHYLGNATQREIGDRLGVNHSTVSRRLEKLVEKLRASVGLLSRSPQPSPAGRARVLKAIAVAASLGAAQQKALAASAAASTPPATSWLSSLAAPVLEPISQGLLAMNFAQKAAATAAILLLAGGGIAVQQGYLGEGADGTRPASGATTVISKEISVPSYSENTFRIPLGETWKLRFIDHFYELDYAIVTATRDGKLDVQEFLKNGEGNTFTWDPKDPEGSGLEDNPQINVWEERSLMRLQSVDVRVAGGAMEVVYFAANKPELLPQAKGLERQFGEGRINNRQLRAAMLDLFAKNGMLPSDPANRARAMRSLDALYRQ